MFFLILGGTRHTSTALYFYGESKGNVHKPQPIFKSTYFREKMYSIIIYKFYIAKVCFLNVPSVFLNWVNIEQLNSTLSKIFILSFDEG
jgi:hypothetical protein